MNLIPFSNSIQPLETIYIKSQAREFITQNQFTRQSYKLRGGEEETTVLFKQYVTLYCMSTRPLRVQNTELNSNKSVAVTVLWISLK